jgi:hypothetical protein
MRWRASASHLIGALVHVCVCSTGSLYVHSTFPPPVASFVPPPLLQRILLLVLASGLMASYLSEAVCLAPSRCSTFPPCRMRSKAQGNASVPQ